MNNKISNPKVEVSKGIGFNDKDYITWLLNILKEMEKNYVIMMSEASNEKLYDKYMECFIEMAVLQREVYEEMFRHGWYQVEAMEEEKIQEKKVMLERMYNELEIAQD